MLLFSEYVYSNPRRGDQHRRAVSAVVRDVQVSQPAAAATRRRRVRRSLDGVLRERSRWARGVGYVTIKSGAAPPITGIVSPEASSWPF
jgi:hypothetical protein